MAMEYIYVDSISENALVELKNFKGLQYRREYDGLEILDSKGEVLTYFYVKDYTCYLLQRRNQSTMQLHEVTPPFKLLDKLPWLFGFASRQRYDSHEDFAQACQRYRDANPSSEVFVKECDFCELGLEYAYALEKAKSDYVNKPIAYHYIHYGELIFNQKTRYQEIVECLHDTFGEFKYPLQYVIHLFKSSTLSYPVETRKFFHERLGYRNRKDVYYADLPGDF